MILICIYNIRIGYQKTRAYAMYICICNAITDNEIRQAVYKGSNCLNSLQKCLPVGTECGTCCCLAKQVIEETLEEIKTSSQNQVA
jgi:bacterioferritin-associated ferredoxin